MTFSPTFTYPYFESASTVGNREGYPITLDGFGYMPDTSNNTPYNETWHRSSVDMLNAQQNPDDDWQSLLPPEVWRRSITSWHRGAGQEIGDLKISDPYRFMASKGVNPWTKHRLSLLNDTEVVEFGGGSIKGVVVNGLAVVSIGTSVHIFSDSPNTVAQFWMVDHTPTRFIPGMPSYEGQELLPGVYTTTLSLPAEPSDVATDGRYAFFVVGDVLYRISPTYGTTTVETVTLPISPSMIEFCNGHMVAGVDTNGSTNGVLYNISAITADMSVDDWNVNDDKIGETVTPVYWRGGCSGKAAMFFLAGTGVDYGVYSVSITSGADSVELSAPARVADLPVGEIGNSIYSYLGYVMIGTSEGIRFAAGDDANLVYGPLIGIGRPVECFVGFDRFVWFGWSDYEGASGTGRLDISEFALDLQPAYASDVMADGEDGLVTWVGIVNGRPLFGVEDAGVFRQTDTPVASGWIEMSDWTFGVADRKIGFYTQVTTEPLVGILEAQVTLDESVYRMGATNDQGETTHRYSLSGQTFSSVNLHLTLVSDGTAGPVARSAELRATYVRGEVSEWRIPILVRDALELPLGAVDSRNVTADYLHLIGLYESGKPFVYSEGELSWNVFATGFLWSPTELSEVRDGWQGVFTLVCREVR